MRDSNAIQTFRTFPESDPGSAPLKAAWESPTVRSLDTPDIQVGSVISYPESVPTFSGLFVGAAES